MIKKDEIDEIERTRIAREIERIREVWENGRDERNLRSTLEFKNRATWAMFKIFDGVK